MGLVTAHCEEAAVRHRGRHQWRYPLDQNIYQAVKGMTSAEATNKEGGVIIMVAGLSDGHGGVGFYNNLAQSKTPQEFLERVAKTDRRHTVPDQWDRNSGAYPGTPSRDHGFRSGEAGNRDQHAYGTSQDF